MASATVAPLSSTVSATLPLTVVSLPSLAAEALDATLEQLARSFESSSLLVTSPDPAPALAAQLGVAFETYTSSAQSHTSWVPTAGDYLDTWISARSHSPRCILLLGADSASVSPDTLRRLADTVLSGDDLVVPHYPFGPNEGLVNSAILYPLTRALFSHPARFPLPIDVALSPRMAERIATAAQRLTSAGQDSSLLWPVSEAAVAGFLVREVNGDPRSLPHPTADSLNTILATVAGSLFTDIEAKAAFWQRARLTPARTIPMHASPNPASSDHQTTDLAPMIDAFRNAYINLRELWSLVLPPNSLLSLKKLSLAPIDQFTMPDALWARTLYDFLLAYRLRTINRGHLLGALTPLYLAWVASHLRQTAGDAERANRHVEEVATAFENDKPYLVARWRWPDRFNP